MPLLNYTVSDFVAFTKIRSADVNSRFNDIKTLLNVTGLDDTNLQNAGITRATKLKLGTASHVVINDGTGAMSSEAQLAATRGGTGINPSFTGNAGAAIVVNAGETAFELGAPSADSLTFNLSGDVATCTAGEAITANDAVCLDLNNGVYKVFQCDSDLGNRKSNFLGIAQNSASVTAANVTWVNSAALVTGNSIAWSINGSAYTQAFTTDNDTTLAAIATQIAGHPDVLSASVVDAGANDRQINIVGRGARTISITGATVTGGASQASVAITVTQAPVGGAVRIRYIGKATGLSGLTVGAVYYLGTTAGGITSTPSDSSPVRVGQAVSSTVLLLSAREFVFPTSSVMVEAFGQVGSVTVNGSSGSSSVSHYNFSAWSVGTADSTGYSCGASSDGAYLGNLLVIAGVTTANSDAAVSRKYNKTSWSALGANAANISPSYGCAAFSGQFYAVKGATGGGSGTTRQTYNYSWNNASWTANTVFATASGTPGAFVYGGKLRVISGNTGSTSTLHETWDGASIASDTVRPAACTLNAGQTAGSLGVSISRPVDGTYFWNGSWSAANNLTYVCHNDPQQNNGPMTGQEASGAFHVNGGVTAAPALTTITNRSVGSSWSATVASTTARGGGYGATI